jgi:WD40 repeat protein
LGVNGQLRNGASGIWGVWGSGDGRWLAGGGSLDGTVRVWDRRTGQLAAGLRDHPHRLTGAAFADRAALVATSDERGEVRLWDLEAGTSRVVVPAGGEPFFRFVLSPDGSRLALLALDEVVRLFDTTDGKLLVRKAAAGSLHLKWSPDGRTLAAKTAKKLTLFDASLESPRELRGLEGFGAFAFSSDGRTLAIATHQNGVQLWQTTTGRKLLHLPDSNDVSDLAFTPDGRTLRGLTANRAREWVALPAGAD